MCVCQAMQIKEEMSYLIFYRNGYKTMKSVKFMCDLLSLYHLPLPRAQTQSEQAMDMQHVSLS